MKDQWKPKKKTGGPLEATVFEIDPKSEVFAQKFDEIQQDLESLASMDELLSGTEAWCIGYSGGEMGTVYSNHAISTACGLLIWQFWWTIA